MGIWTHSLKFNVSTGGIHQLPQKTGDEICSLLQEVVWDVGDNVPNPVLQLFHCARFCPVHLLLCPAPQEKVTGREIWTSGRSFVRTSSSQPTSRKPLIQPGTYHRARKQVHRCFPSQFRYTTRNLPAPEDSVWHSRRHAEDMRR